MKKLTKADYDLLKARGNVVNGFNTTKDGDDEFRARAKVFPKFKINKVVNESKKSLNNQVIDKINEVYKKARIIYGRSFFYPTILFKKRGNVAGTANSGTNTLNFNMILLKENTEHFLNQTIPHECAHLFADELYGGGCKKMRSHGIEWRSVMYKLGLNPDRCHTYDTSNATVYQKEKFVYKCNCQHHVIGPTRHKKCVRLSIYRCNKCKGALVFVKRAGKVSREEALKTI